MAAGFIVVANIPAGGHRNLGAHNCVGCGMTHPAVDVVVWDFDGVLNRKLPRETYVWAASVAAGRGYDPASFEDAVFASGRFAQIMRGQLDLLEVVREWLSAQNADEAPDAFLEYWFAHQATPDAEVGRWLDLCPLRNVIGTNNDPRRAEYIENAMGFGARVERIFASGRIRAIKPEPGFYQAVEEALGVKPGQILLIDDNAAYVAGAHRQGWNAFHFTESTRHRLPGLLGID